MQNICSFYHNVAFSYLFFCFFFYFFPVLIFKVGVLSFLIITFKSNEVINTEFQQVRDLLFILLHGFLTKYLNIKAFA